MGSRSIFSRVGTGAVSQALSSLSNVLFMAWMTRTQTTRNLGWFALGYGLHFFFIQLVRAATSDVLALSGLWESEGEERRDAIRKCYSACAVMAAGLLVIMVLPAIAAPSGARMPLLVLALGTPFLYFHECSRGIAIAGRTAIDAVKLDGIWLALLLIALGVSAPRSVRTTPELIVGFWVGGAAIAFLVVKGRELLTLSLHAAREWRAKHGSTARELMVESVALRGGNQISTIMIGVVAGATALGTFRSGQTLQSPLNFMFLATPMLLVPELTGKADPRKRKLMFGAIVLLCLVVFAWTCVLYLLPTDIGRTLLRRNFGVGLTLAWVLGVRGFARALINTSSAWLRAHRQTKITSRLGVQFAVPTIAAAVIGAFIAGAKGAAIALASIDFIRGFILWRHTQKSMRDADGVDQADNAEESTAARSLDA